MSLMHPRSFACGIIVLFAVWVWPLQKLALPPFSSHMFLHMLVVALAAPLLAWGIVGSAWDPVRSHPGCWSAVVASMVEFVAVWVWHLPHLHHLARSHPGYFAAEQATFLLAGLALWVTAWGGTPKQRAERSMGGVTGLLLTSMHMTLLGALLALAKRPLYEHGSGHAQHAQLSPLIDQQVGGAIMLVLGAVSYLAGGVLLAKVTWLSRIDPAPGELS